MSIVASITTTLMLTMNVSVYTPGANEISGGAITASGEPVAELQAACGNAYPFGTQFEVIGPAADELRKHGIATNVVCKDRGAWVTNLHLDISLVVGERNDRLKRAFAFGRRWAPVRVSPPEPPQRDVRGQRVVASKEARL